MNNNKNNVKKGKKRRKFRPCPMGPVPLGTKVYAERYTCPKCGEREAAATFDTEPSKFCSWCGTELPVPRLSTFKEIVA